MKAIFDELSQRIQPALISALEIASKLRGLLRAKKLNPISSLGFKLSSIEDVITSMQETSSLLERLSLDTIKAKKDTRTLLRFLNHLCIETAGETQIENSSNDLAKVSVKS